MAFPFRFPFAAPYCGASGSTADAGVTAKHHLGSESVGNQPCSTTAHSFRRKVLFEPLEPRLLLSADLGVLDDGGLNDYFDEVQRQLDSAVFSAPIPLIGTQLSEKQSGRVAERISIALQSFTVLPANGTSATAEDVKSGLSASLGSLILGGQILDTTNPDHSEYRFSLTLAGSESASTSTWRLATTHLSTHDWVSWTKSCSASTGASISLSVSSRI